MHICFLNLKLGHGCKIFELCAVIELLHCQFWCIVASPSLIHDSLIHGHSPLLVWLGGRMTPFCEVDSGRLLLFLSKVGGGLRGWLI